MTPNRSVSPPHSPPRHLGHSPSQHMGHPIHASQSSQRFGHVQLAVSGRERGLSITSTPGQGLGPGLAVGHGLGTAPGQGLGLSPLDEKFDAINVEGGEELVVEGGTGVRVQGLEGVREEGVGRVGGGGGGGGAEEERGRLASSSPLRLSPISSPGMRVGFSPHHSPYQSPQYSPYRFPHDQSSPLGLSPLGMSPWSPSASSSPFCSSSAIHTTVQLLSLEGKYICAGNSEGQLLLWSLTSHRVEMVVNVDNNNNHNNSNSHNLNNSHNHNNNRTIPRYLSNATIHPSFSPTRMNGTGVGELDTAIYTVIELHDGKVCCGGADGLVRIYDIIKTYQQHHQQQQQSPYHYQQQSQQHQYHHQQQDLSYGVVGDGYIDGDMAIDMPVVLEGHTDWIR